MNGSGHPDSIGIGSSAELVPFNSHHANDNGRHDEAPEP